MTKAEEITFQLLRAALWGTELPAIDAPIVEHWEEIKYIAQKQSIPGLIGQSTKRWAENAEEEIEKLQNITIEQLEAVINEALEMMLQTMKANKMLNDVLKKATGILDENGIRYVLLKGQGVGVNYPYPELRQCGDIDIYLGEEGVEAAKKVLMPLATPGSEEDIAKHFALKINDVELELHRYVVEKYNKGGYKRLQKWTISELKGDDCRKIMINDAEIAVPSKMFNLIFEFEHMQRHFYSYGVGLRQICDWMLCLHHYQKDVDTEELKRLLKEFDLWGVWQIFEAFAVEYLGLRQEYGLGCRDEGLVIKAKRIAELVMEVGNFGHDKEVGYLSGMPKNTLLRKLYTIRHYAKYHRKLVEISAKEAWPWLKDFYFERFVRR